LGCVDRDIFKQLFAVLYSSMTSLTTRMSHDLRSPLQTIMGFAELLSLEIGGPLTAEQQEYVSCIQKDARHLLSLINQLSDS
jgi:signal transduction histidine kinase